MAATTNGDAASAAAAVLDEIKPPQGVVLPPKEFRSESRATHGFLFDFSAFSPYKLELFYHNVRDIVLIHHSQLSSRRPPVSSPEMVSLLKVRPPSMILEMFLATISTSTR